MRKWVVYEEHEQACRAAAHVFLRRMLEAPDRTPLAVALSGGRTPLTFFRHLASSPLKGEIPWSRIHWFWVDERCVGPDHPDSNYGAAKTALFSKVPVDSSMITRIPGELGAKPGARAYADRLHRFFGSGLPVFDFILLGIGADGHTASLFPGEPDIEASETSVLPVIRPKAVPELDRITLSLAVLNAARRTVILATGAGKAGIVAQVRAGDSDLPAARVQGPGVSWILDQAAAAQQ